MNKQNSILIACILAFASIAHAQPYAVGGRVLDKSNRQPLTGVTVVLGSSGTSTDSTGEFELTEVQPGTYKILFSYIGYGDQSIQVTVSDQSIDLGNLHLEEAPISLEEVVVTPGSFSIMGDGPLSKQVLTSENLKHMSWAEDITRAVARLPGISSTDYSSKFTIRGGESDEVLITLDGMELYEPFHQRDFSGGLFSIVDIEAIQGVDLMTGGFSSVYGNRCSGVFNMRTRKITDDRTVIGASIMNARIYREGTFSDGKGSYLITGRRGMLDQVFRAIGETESLPSFWDAMGKIAYKLGSKNTMALHLLNSGDHARIRDISLPDYDSYDTYYHNLYSWLTWESNPTEKLVVKTMLYGGKLSHHRYGSFWKYELTDKGSFDVDDRRNFLLAGIKQDWSYSANDRIDLQAGAELKELKADYNYYYRLDELRVDSTESLYTYSREIDIDLKPTGTQLYTYFNTRVMLLPKLIMETGVRYDATSYSSDKVVSPRASMVYAMSKRTFLRGAFGRYYQSQFINAIDVNNGNTRFNPAKLATHYVLSFQHMFPGGLDLTVSGYYKDYSHLPPQWQNLRDHLEVWPEARNDNALLIFKGATAKGVETFVKYDIGRKMTFWFSYSIAKAQDDLSSIHYAGMLEKRTAKVPRLNNQNHTIYMDLNYRPGDKWHFNLSWQFYQGWPRTDYTYAYTTLPNDSLHFYAVHKRFNGVSYPAYHRMDLRVNRTFELKRGSMTAFLHLINLYNRENLKKFDLDAANDQEQPSLDSNGAYIPLEDNKYWLGFVPAFGVSWGF